MEFHLHKSWWAEWGLKSRPTYAIERDALVGRPLVIGHEEELPFVRKLIEGNKIDLAKHTDWQCQEKYPVKLSINKESSFREVTEQVGHHKR